MPFPLIPILAGIGAGVASAGLARGAAAILSPADRAAQIYSNRKIPNVLPPMEAALDAYQKGWLFLPELAWIMAGHGAYLFEGFPGDAAVGATGVRDLVPYWSAVLNAQLKMPDPDYVRFLYNTGRIDLVTAHDYLLRGGFRSEQIRNLLLVPQAVPTFEQVLTLVNRKIVPPEIGGIWLNQMGFRDAQTRVWLGELRHLIPGYSDLVTMAVRDVWDPPTVQRLRYDEEFPAAFQHWMERAGMGGSAAIPDAAGQPGQPVTWAQLYWRSHWTNISPTQAYEMVQRLRPGRVQRYWQAGFQPQAYTFDDMRTQLKVNDYPPAVRDRLAAIAYRNPRLVDIDRFLDLGEIDEQEAEQYHLDLGYAPVDAARRTRFIARNMRLKRTKAIIGDLRAKLLSSYKAGTLSRGWTARGIYQLAILGRVEEQQFLQLPDAQQEAVALANPYVRNALDAADLEVQSALAKRAVTKLRGRFLHGQIRAGQATTLLLQLGIARPRVLDYIRAWQVEIQGALPLLATQKIQTMAREGILPLRTADEYLRNLGWQQPERGYLLRQIERNIGLDYSKFLEKVARTQAQRAAAIKRQLRELRAEQDRALRELIRQGSPADLMLWFIQGHLSERWYYRALVRLGFEKSVIVHRFAEALLKREGYRRGAKTAELADIGFDAGVLAARIVEEEEAAARHRPRSPAPILEERRGAPEHLPTLPSPDSGDVERLPRVR